MPVLPPSKIGPGLVTSEAFLPRDGRYDEGGGIDHYEWRDVAVLLARQEPSRIGDMADAFFGSIAISGSVFDTPLPMAAEVLDLMGAANPDAVWGGAVRHISSRPDPGTQRILEWAGGGLFVRNGAGRASPPFLDVVAAERVWKWIDADRDKRAALLARYVPKRMERGKRCIARELLARYGGSDAVRRAMHGRFSAGMFFGSRTDYHKREMEQCLGWMDGETDAAVLRWLRERKDHIQASMEKAAEFEERCP